MNEPTKNRITVYEVERFCERLHKLVIEAHPSLGEPKFELDFGTLRVSFPSYLEPKLVDESINLPQGDLEVHHGPVNPEGKVVRKSKKVPQ